MRNTCPGIQSSWYFFLPPHFNIFDFPQNGHLNKLVACGNFEIPFVQCCVACSVHGLMCPIHWCHNFSYWVGFVFVVGSILTVVINEGCSIDGNSSVTTPVLLSEIDCEDVLFELPLFSSKVIGGDVDWATVSLVSRHILPSSALFCCESCCCCWFIAAFFCCYLLIADWVVTLWITYFEIVNDMITWFFVNYWPF